MLWFTLVVPQIVGKTDFGECQLMIQDTRGRTLLSVPLKVDHDTVRREEVLQSMIKDQHTKGCELHFVYVTKPMGSIVKEYVLSIPDYLPAKR